MKIKEIWKPIKNYEGYYEVSNHGRVRSLDRTFIDSIGRKQKCRRKILQQTIRKDGYFNVILSKANHRKSMRVNRLVGLTFIDSNYKQHFDHINQNKLNNHVSNLRIATRSQNQANSKIRKGTSKFKGVHFDKRNNKPWRAAIRINKIKTCLGAFKTENEAALAYNVAAKKYFKEFAYLNKV